MEYNAIFKKILFGIFFATLLFSLSAQEKERPKIAVVLAGGGAWGLAHIGVLKVLEEAGIPIDIVVGTSMGSIVGGLYAAGFTSDQIRQIALGADWTNLFFESSVAGNTSFLEIQDKKRYAFGINFNRDGISLNSGILPGYNLLRFFDALTLRIPAPADFDSLPRRFRAVATDLETGERVVFSDGFIADAMRSSMSIPGVFTPWFIDNRYLIDGGVVDNLPIDVAREMGADIIIAVDLLSKKPLSAKDLERSPVSTLGNMLNIFIRGNVTPQLKDADILFSVDVQDFSQTDFQKVTGLAEVGEKTAREQLGELEALYQSLLAYSENPKNEIYVFPARLPPLKTIKIYGASESDRKTIYSIFAPLAGQVPDTVIIQAIFTQLDKTGRYRSVRVYRNSEEEGYPLIVRLERKIHEKHAIRVSFLYETTFASSITGNVDFIPGVVLYGLTNTDSQLIADVEVLDSPGINLRFIQPIGRKFYISPFFTYSQEFITRLTGRSVGYQYQTISLNTGVDLAFNPVPVIEFRAGWNFRYIIAQEMPGLPEEGSYKNNLNIFTAGFSIDRTDAAIFPTKGISMSADYLISLETKTVGHFFNTLNTKGVAVLPIGTPFSLSLMWKGGTDFSERFGNVLAAPVFYKPDLSDRRLFPGPLKITEQIGSHVAGLGVEVKFKPNWSDKGFTLPVFILIQGAVGAVIQSITDIDVKETFHWNVSVGGGIRVSSAFGLALRAGVHVSIEKDIMPFVAFDLGAISY
ncbi:patatin-like phospholipase family protein [Brucepastera parasyntrophica]|uniref:patatin-like phospholipase family protein n=1 Tax=Brucepastera parasyntrophica TaxID=2880008 RepID=UPI002108F5F1|nr:patatin-like phospholipase family protein [Brucepastera parasyntrophica]ULQ59007.1 patatin-like phospholipase family protein [Brucepastera parasyntrophica]